MLGEPENPFSLTGATLSTHSGQKHIPIIPLGGRRLMRDSAAAKITNVSGANKVLSREYRLGWEI